jgi:hypothetical protein
MAYTKFVTDAVAVSGVCTLTLLNGDLAESTTTSMAFIH